VEGGGTRGPVESLDGDKEELDHHQQPLAVYKKAGKCGRHTFKLLGIAGGSRLSIKSRALQAGLVLILVFSNSYACIFIKSLEGGGMTLQAYVPKSEAKPGPGLGFGVWGRGGFRV
jgi:hypothetical protein